MRVIVVNTGTELLLGDVVNTHLAFIAQEILPLGLRIDVQVAVPDGAAIRTVLEKSFADADVIFVTGGLGPTTDDVTRDEVAGLLNLELREDAQCAATIRERLRVRRIPMTNRILRQAVVPAGAEVLPNENGTAPGLYLRANLNPAVASPHLFLLPGPPRELRPMFVESVGPRLRKIAHAERTLAYRNYRIAGMGESLVERAVGEKILALGEVELGYCARPGEVDVRVLGEPALVAQADEILRTALGAAIYSTEREEIEQVLIAQLTERCETVATAESCTGGLLAHRLTNVPGASVVFLGGFVAYANETKVSALGVVPDLLTEYGAVSEAVARVMAEQARVRVGATYTLATTGIAGPGGGTEAKPVGTVFIALATEGEETLVRPFRFLSDRETFKQLTAQTAFDLLRKKLETRSR